MINKYSETPKLCLTPREAAAILNVSLSTLKKLIYRGEISTFKTPGGHHRISREELLRSMHNNLSLTADKTANKSLSVITNAFVYLLERKLIFCKGHSAKVADISLAIANEMGFSRLKQQRIYLAALMHDIGKFLISESILNKQDGLSPEEYLEIKKHPLLGSDFLNSIEILQDLATIVRQHHERFDGSGYPHGLKADEILPEAKIISLAETFVCMTAENSYHKSYSIPDAICMIQKNAGTQFDPRVVEVFLKLSKTEKISKSRETAAI